MILQGTKNAIDRGGDNVVENVFKIKATGKAFKILSDGLYSDKPLAVVRELCCNAYDAHVAAGRKNLPFTVHLPNHLEPYFSVRDEGIGLSKAQVENIFTTYFESTKSDSNEYIGALGLGSKSPFSYVDSFTVISRYNGVKYSFNAFMNEDDIPAIALLMEEETSEGNGVEITMPVRSADFNTFADKAESVLEWFDPQPTIVGNHRINIRSRKFSITGTGWKLESNDGSRWDYGYRSRQFTAVQGRIGYPVGAEAMSQHCSEGQMAILQANFVADFDIGELEVAASREHLSFKPTTIENIKKKIDVILAELPTKFQGVIDDCKTKWDASAKLRELQGSNTIIATLIHYKAFTLTWQGQPLNSQYVSVPYKDLPGMVIAYYHGRSVSRSIADDLKLSSFTTQPDANIQFVINDLKRGAQTRLRQYAKANNGSNSYLLTCADAGRIDWFLEQIGSPSNVIQASDLPAPPARERVAKATIRLMELSKATGEYVFDLNTDDVDLEEGGFYVPLLRDHPVMNNDCRFCDFDRMIIYATKLGLIKADEVVYGVTRVGLKQIKDRPEWLNLFDTLVERYRDWVVTNDLNEQILAKKSYSEWWGSYMWICRWIDHIDKYEACLGYDHQVIVHKREIDKARSFDTDTASALGMILEVTLTPLGIKDPYNFDSNWKTIAAKYPLLNMGLTVDTEKGLKPAVEYIQLIDAKNNLACN
jgi:hypothetical protein